jgi:hypothetical protein
MPPARPTPTVQKNKSREFYDLIRRIGTKREYTHERTSERRWAARGEIIRIEHDDDDDDDD